MALKIVFEILSPLPLTSREEGIIVFDLWQRYLPDLLPDKFGNWEPIDHPFYRQNIEQALDAWRWPFLATKNNPMLDVGIWMRKSARQNLHSTWVFRLDAGQEKPMQLQEFLEAAAVALRADFSCLHLLTLSELQRGRANKTVSALNRQATKFSFLVTSKDLQERIPDMFWITVFGAPYVTMFGQKSLMSAPAYRVRLLSNGAVLMQMTEKLSDIEQRPEIFDEVRAKIKTHLGKNAFFDPKHRRSNGYRVPRFDFFMSG